MTAPLELLEQHRLFGGWQQRYRHTSAVLQCDMTFSLYLPPTADKTPPTADKTPPPVLYWLSGLTCTDENFAVKAGAQRVAAELGLALVIPDTSPRGEAVADDSGYDLGQGAGFYVNATEAPWQPHYRMFDYLSDELPQLIRQHVNVSDRQSISGHSMGGHGALMLALRHPGRYRSASAFAPIVNPSAVPWGRKAFSAYLGEDEQQWRDYDSCHLLAASDHPLPILIDQGEDDPFLPEQLQPHALDAIARQREWPLTLRMQPGYDHSYFFIASFIEDHLRFHGKFLQQ